MNKTYISRIISFIPIIGMLIMIFASCNSKEEDNIYYSPDSMVAVTSFSLKANSSVMKNLDSVFFSIDLDNGVIFNADSLPKGTKTTSLIPVITYPSSVAEAVITMEGGNLRTGTVNYKKNPSDTIDFTGNVTLTLTAEDGVTSRSYRLKVNVHQSQPDSLVWDKTATSSLPSRMASPRNQKSIATKDGVASLIEENDGTFTLATSSDLFSAIWEKKTATLPSGADIRSFTTDETDFYILDNSGNLHKSSDCLTWEQVAKDWTNIIGASENKILGISLASGKRYFCSYANGVETISDSSAEEFPKEGFSNMTTSKSEWSPAATAFVAGGVRTDGTLSNDIWAHDGESWIKLSEGGFPALEGASLVSYRYFKKTSTMWVQTEFPVWMIIGGRTADKTFNRNVYISFDNCVTWAKAGESMVLPDFIPDSYFADCVVLDTPLSADISDAWTKAKAPRRINYEIDGYDISWKCPYIYMIGGYNNSGILQNLIWRSVIARLTFVPLI